MTTVILDKTSKRYGVKMISFRKSRTLIAAISLLIGSTSVLTAYSAGAATARMDANAVLKVGLFGDVATQDPAAAGFNAASNFLVANAIFDPLFVAENGKFTPFLAKGISASEDQKTWTMTLPTGVKFSDWTNFNAAAVKFNFDRFMNPATKCGCAGLVGNIANVTAPNATTVVFELKSPTSGFPTALVKEVGFISSPAAIKKYGTDYAKNPVGTGPYRLSSLTPGVGATLIRNNAYRNRSAILMAGIEFKVILDNSTRYSSLRTGGLDLILTDSAADIESASADKLQSKIASFNGSLTGIFNFKKPAMADVDVRTAIAQAIDVDTITKIVDKGLVKRGNGPFGADSDWVTGKFATQYNPANSKKLLAAYGKPVEVTYLTGVSEIQKQRATLIQQMLAAVGIKMTIDQQGGGFVGKLVSGDFDIVELGSPDFIDPDIQLTRRFGSASGQNFGKYNSPAVDKFLKDAAATGVLSTRQSIYTQMTATIMKDLPYIWMNQNYYGVLYGPKVVKVPALNEADLGLFRIGAVGKTK
jgi:peptide/nickel transport system substrate-binding protein